MKDYLIVGNGPFVAKTILLEASFNKTIVALDGAADQLNQLGIQPHVILGDFDSIQTPDFWGIKHTFHELKNEDLPYEGKAGILIVPAKNQLHTDLTKAILYCDQEKAASITIICAAYGRLDQHEGALRSLRVYYRKDRLILFHTETQTMRFARDEVIKIEGKVGDQCGVIAYPQGRMSSKGLVYEARGFTLAFGYSENICNVLAREIAEVEVQGEALVIMPGILRSQK